MNKLNVGDLAPDFTSQDDAGEKISLSDFRGRKIILYFYPKDDTPGCTLEACNLRDEHDGLLKEGYVVLGVSPDGVSSHQKFKNKYQLPFRLVADGDKTILNKYGVYGPKNMYGKEVMGVYRTTFIIDEVGKIERIIDKVKTKEHAQQILENS